MSTNAYMAAYMRRRYHQQRLAAISSLGGRCVRCGTTEKLEIDHIDRTSKTIDLGKKWSVNSDTFNSELAKCQLLCNSCHKAKSAQECSVPHGGGASGKKNCPCEPCRSRKREYMRNWKRAS